MTETSVSSFVMHGSRDAISRGLTHIQQQVDGIEGAVSENPGLAFDLAKVLVESTCRTILKERNVAFDLKDDLQKLFRSVKQHLPFLPSSTSQATDIRQSLDQTLNGLNTAIQGICELRNKCGYASHGSEDLRPQMESAQAFLAVQAADTIVGFLYQIHQQDRSVPVSSLPKYEDNSDFNDFVDENHTEVRIFDSEFRPSEIMYQMEPESYRVSLADFRNAANTPSVNR